MKSLEGIIYELNALELADAGQSRLHRLNAVAKLLLTLAFLCLVLSIPLHRVEWLLPCFVYPVGGCLLGRMKYSRLFRRSLVVLPFVLCIGLFNPFVQREVMFSVGGFDITEGWVTLVALLLRGLLTMQAVLLLIQSTGFYRLCRALERLYVPRLLTMQLLFLYRYLLVLLQETLSMRRAVASRGYGRTNYPLRFWGTFTGQLLLRTLERAQRIHQAMLARGFSTSSDTQDSALP